MPIAQKAVVSESEGDAWFTRNLPRLGELAAKGCDPVIEMIRQNGVRTQNILEIGCSHGWRLELLRKASAAFVAGIDPSLRAIEEGRKLYPEIELMRGTADALPFQSARFDMVIYGFCLYLCDRADLFKIVAEGDRVLAENGYLVIYDFHAERPHSRRYGHDARLTTYKTDNSALFLANPAYKLVAQRMIGADGGIATSEDDRVAISLLKKNLDGAYPLRGG